MFKAQFLQFKNMLYAKNYNFICTQAQKIDTIKYSECKILIGAKKCLLNYVSQFFSQNL